jgi:hypothetical protein
VIKRQFETARISWFKIRWIGLLSTGAANILSTDQAAEVGVQVVRAFVRLRNFVLAHEDLVTELAKLETRVTQQDKKIKLIAIRGLMKTDVKPKPQIGFKSS